MGILFFVLTALMFSTFEVVSKSINIDSIILTFIRFFIGGAILFPIAIRIIIRKKIRFGRKDILALWGLGLLLMFSCILLQVALVNTTASYCAFVFSLNTVFTALVGWLILKERPEKIIWITFAICLIGMLIITNPFSGDFNYYQLLAVASALLYSIFNVCLFRIGKKYGNLVCTSISITFGSLSLGLLLKILGNNLLVNINSENILKILFIGVISSATVYVMYFKTMEAISVNIASAVFFVKPVLATVLAIFILNEIPDKMFLIGAVIILLGMSILLYSKVSKNTEAKSEDVKQ